MSFESVNKIKSLQQGVENLIGENCENLTAAVQTVKDETDFQSSLIYQIKTNLNGKAAGSGSAPAKEEQEKELSVTENGNYEIVPDSGKVMSKATVEVKVPERYDEGYSVGKQEGYDEGYQKGFNDNKPVVEPLEVTENGTYTTPVGVDGYSPVSVNVPIPDGYIIPSGTKEITENGTHDVTEYASVNVDVASGGGEENQLHGTLDGTLTSIDSNVTKVISYACYGITTLQTVNLPNATSLGGYTFRGCSGLTSINAPKVTSLGSYSFYACSELTEINFPLATSVPSTCFYQCSALVKADFGVNCKSIAASAMAYCTALKTLILRYTGGVVSTTTNAFSGVTSYKGYVYVPKALLENYEAAAEASTSSTNSWHLFTGKFRAIEDYPDICGG